MTGSLYDHAAALHEQFPDSPLPRDGSPYPDDERYRGAHRSNDYRSEGIDVAAALDAYFASRTMQVEELAETLAGLDVPIHHNEHIAAAALRADSDRVRRTGRRLVRHGHDRRAVVVGLALLATDNDERDIPLIRTIGLLSNYFGPMAARALRRRRHGTEALTWLGDRTAGWGRVYVVEALCKSGIARPWLLRHACDGDTLNGYFAAKVATAAHLHAAMTCEDVDEEVVDHTGRLLSVMTWCSGMGMDLWDYPAAAPVVEAYARHVDRLPRTDVRMRCRVHLAESLQKIPLTGLNTSTVVAALLG
ncbi:hypothetical protein [Lentzea californiensis]|uniref:hypothetical protein n=1 Tax=Lentzea californiensis TaxID=438851 RepID=UPI0021662DD9|nr:hypothetical protein [Lentzea californiensis]MCR3754294.1 hypothetical protein [Lentzea californiensis]